MYAGLITVLVSRHVADKAANLKTCGSVRRFELMFGLVRRDPSFFFLRLVSPTVHSHRIISLKINSGIKLLSLFPFSLCFFFFNMFLVCMHCPFASVG